MGRFAREASAENALFPSATTRYAPSHVQLHWQL